MSHHKFEDIAVRLHARGLGLSVDLWENLNLEQLGKLDEIVEILDALPPVSIDDELDSVLDGLREMRDRDG